MNSHDERPQEIEKPEVPPMMRGTPVLSRFLTGDKVRVYMPGSWTHGEVVKILMLGKRRTGSHNIAGHLCHCERKKVNVIIPEINLRPIEEKPDAPASRTVRAEPVRTFVEKERGR